LSRPTREELLARYLLSQDGVSGEDFDRWLDRESSGREEAGAGETLTLPGERTLPPRRGAAEEPGAGSATPPSHPAPGVRIGDFRLLRLLGSGGMGEVWEALQIPLGRRVALKLIRPGRGGPQALERFAREARAGGRLSHPAIVTVHASGDAGGLHWIAMELVEGGETLRTFLDRVREREELPEGYHATVATLVAEIAEALQAAHDAHVIHRDIKPQNLLLTAEGRPKITDFGLARLSDETSLSMSGDLVGTYLYMSPEQVAANRMGIDHRTDIFSLGVVLYELLGLVRPFEGDTTHQVAAKILTHDPPDLRSLRSRLPAELALIAGKALEKRREARYQSMGELAADLRRFLAHEPIHARPPGWARRAEKWVRRHPTASLATCLLSLGLLGTSVTGLWALRSAADARRGQEQVFRLTAGVELASLLEAARSDALWPTLPEREEDLRDWLRRAEDLLIGLHPDPRGGYPGHLGQLEAIRARGRREVPEPAVSSSQDSRRLAQVREEILSLEQAQARRRGDLLPEDEVGSTTAVPPSDGELTLAAWRLVAPGREMHGSEIQGLAWAEKALQQASSAFDQLWAFLTWCEACLATGLEERALEELGSFGEILEGRAALAFELFDADFRTRATSASELAEARIGQLRAELARREGETAEPVWHFADERDRWWHDQLASLVQGLQALADPERGAIEGRSPELGWGVRLRLEALERLRAESLEGEDASRLWAEAIAAIADPVRSPGYGGLSIRPQHGLLPIGADPESGLWEFAHLLSGAPARRDESGRLIRAPEMGIVLVLLPAGVFRGEAVAPHFLSKYEMTQAQWERIACANPSKYAPLGQSEPGISPLNPVESVSWQECQSVLWRLDLALPTVAQWCRAAGWREEVHPSQIPVALHPRDTANLSDFPMGGTDPDGFRLHAPVGSFPPDPLGFHDLRGNVSEWCTAVAEASEPRSRQPSGASLQPVLGSSWVGANSAPETYILQDDPRNGAASRGLRPARPLRL
jgi:hypothetical protein